MVTHPPFVILDDICYRLTTGRIRIRPVTVAVTNHTVRTVDERFAALSDSSLTRRASGIALCIMNR